jgi:FkbM family methyltransferase
MRTVKDLEQLHATGKSSFGYVDITMFPTPPFVMFTNNDCGICWAQRTGAAFEPGSTALWAALVPHATSVFDIGSRCGEFSLMAAALRPGVKIHAFEPNPDNFARLLVNMLANAAPNMRVHRIALSDTESYAPFTWVTKKVGHLSSGGSLLRPPGHPAGTDTIVQTRPLDKLAANFTLGDRPLFKIDVEEAEVHVFRGMPEILKKRPDMIVECLQQDNCDKLMSLVEGLGYRYYLVCENEKKLIQRDRLIASLGDSVNYNHLFTTRDFGPEISLADPAIVRDHPANRAS